MEGHGPEGLIGVLRRWFKQNFPAGPTPGQAAAWQSIGQGRHTLLVAPTGTGKTLAGFTSVLDRLLREHEAGILQPGLRCVYISPLRSLGYDIERNLAAPLEAIRRNLGLESSPISIGVRTGDTSPHERRKISQHPPHILITTPESLSLLLSHDGWLHRLSSVEQIIVDEIHALVATKRGVDLAASLERLCRCTKREPVRIGLSATCGATAPVARFLCGPQRSCAVLEPLAPQGHHPPVIEVESLIEPDEAAHRGLSYRRLLRYLDTAMEAHRTTLVFANTRAFTERLTHDLQLERKGETVDRPIAAHHSALDAARRREVERALKAGELRAVFSSTSLELGIDIGSVDLSVLVGLPGSVSRCLQRVGRAGHQIGTLSQGVILAATPAELAGAAVTAYAARRGEIEPLHIVPAPLDVLCQQLIGMACAGECQVDQTYDLLRQSAPFADLERSHFDACVAFLAGDLAAPAGAHEPEPGATPRFTAARIWRANGHFGVRSARVVRWFRMNVGTIYAEPSAQVECEGRVVGTLDADYADRLIRGDRFILDGRSLEFRSRAGERVHVRHCPGEPVIPRWISDRQSLTPELARAVGQFRETAAELLFVDGPEALEAWLIDHWRLPTPGARVLVELFQAQATLSEIPRPSDLLIERSSIQGGTCFAFHAPLPRNCCEALGRAIGARLGRRYKRDLSLEVADLGWVLHVPGDFDLDPSELHQLLDPGNFLDDVLEGLDRGDLPARRFRHVAATALMVLRNPDGNRTRVGGLNWVSNRLYPLVKAACPDHPLLRETRREVLEELLDAPRALAWLQGSPRLRYRALDGFSPFTAAWIAPAIEGEILRFEPPELALRRLHERLVGMRP